MANYETMKVFSDIPGEVSPHLVEWAEIYALSNGSYADWEVGWYKSDEEYDQTGECKATIVDAWLRSSGVPDGENVLIHWSW